MESLFQRVSQRFRGRGGRILLSLLVLPVLFILIYLFLPKGPRDPMEFDDPTRQPRELVRARSYAVVTGSPWATEVAMEVLAEGGTAADAAVAALLMLTVTNGEAASFPSIAPTLLYDAQSRRVRSYTGVGTAPERATLERFREAGYESVPDLHIWAQLLPASPDVVVSLLTSYGSRPFRELVAPAIETAREGFPVSETMAENLDFSLLERIGLSLLLPYNAKVYLQGQWWRPLHRGSRFTRPDLANTLETLAEEERIVFESGGDRLAQIGAVRDQFYRGELAAAILSLHSEKDGLFQSADLSEYAGEWEEPISASFGRYTLYTNGTWSQGMTALMALRYLEGSDLRELGHNSAAYIHRVLQALELAFADRDGYLGDPAFVDVPLGRLLSREHANKRKEAFQERAFGVLPEPGPVEGYEPFNAGAAAVSVAGEGDERAISDLYGPCAPREGDERGANAASPLAAALKEMVAGGDTTQLLVLDAGGNGVAITPSDFPKSPMVPGTGMTLGNRMVQFRLDERSPNVLAPGKRPRVTPHAIMVHRDGEPWLMFNTPGGDMQAQALLQVYLNLTTFDMGLQEAVSAPRFRSVSVPSSFAPHEAEPGTLWIEEDLLVAVEESLAGRGYSLEAYPRWDNHFGSVGAIISDRDETGERLLLAAADPREHTWADGE